MVRALWVLEPEKAPCTWQDPFNKGSPEAMYNSVVQPRSP